MWINLGSLFLGNFQWQAIANSIQSPQIQIEIDESSIPVGYLPRCQDLIIIARDFADGSTETCGTIRPQNPKIIFQLNSVPVGFSSFFLKLKKIPRYRYGLGLNLTINYWQ